MLEVFSMKPLRVYLPEELEKKFRKFSMETYGYSHGSLSKAAAEAITSWVSTRQIAAQVAVPDEPVKAVRGLLRLVKKSSVELQHEAAQIRAEKANGECKGCTSSMQTSSSSYS
jgi:hypothetical protein